MNPDAVIAHLRCASGGGGGADRVILNTVPRLQARTLHQAVLYLTKPGAEVGGLVDPLRREGLLCQIMTGRRLFDLRQFLTVRRFALDHRVRVLHCHDAKADVYGFVLRLIHPSLKVISTLHGWTEKTRRGRLYSRLDKAVLRRFDAAIAVSEHTARLAREQGIRRVFVVPNGIDTEEWQSTGSGHSHPNKAPFTVGFVGRISAEKGPLEFVDIARRVLLQQPGSRFVVLGEGPDLPAMKGAVSAAGLDRNFAFRGYQPREALKEAYEAMEVLVLPSRREGLPLSLLEACAMGVCVAAFSVGGIPEVIVHGQNGLLAQPGDTGDLAAQIVALRQDTQLAARLRSQARATVVSHFGIRTQVRQLESVYAEVLGSGPPRNPDRPVPKS